MTESPSTTTTIPVCNEETGMDEPVDIQPEQVSYSEQPEETSPPGDINPTTTTPGLNFPSDNPEISVTLDSPATVTVVYIPTDRPDEPSNVDEFTVVFVYPDGTTSETFTSTPPSTSESSETTTPTPSDTVPPSDESPKVILPPNFEVPEGTTVVITITSTDDDQPPTGVTVGIIACVEPSATTTPPQTSTDETNTEAAPVTPGETTASTTVPPTTTSVETTLGAEAPTTTTTFEPTTTTMDYCADENGMNQPLDIQPDQVSYDQQPEETSPTSDINPTSSTPGIDFASPYPKISISFNEPTTTTLIYIPTDRPNEPSNVQLFVVTFSYPDGTQSEAFTSQIPSETAGIITPSTVSNGIVSPSSTSPQIDLPSNFEVPSGTVLVLTIIATTDANAPKNVTVGIVACVEITTTTTEATSASTTVVPLTTTPGETSVETSPVTEVTTTATSQPTTTTIPICNEETGMDRPLDILPEQVTYSEQPEETSPPGDINPTTTTPGLNFPSENPEINVTFDSPATVTVVYVPTDRPNEPSNVDEFTVVFVYPNGTTSETFTSTPPSPSESSETTTTTPTPSDTVAPSDESPKVILPPNFEVPEGTTVVITITSTDDDQPATGVSFHSNSAELCQ